MPKGKSINSIRIATQLESVIEGLNKAISPVNSKERVLIICEQIATLRSIKRDIAKGGTYNG